MELMTGYRQILITEIQLFLLAFYLCDLKRKFLIKN